MSKRSKRKTRQFISRKELDKAKAGYEEQVKMLRAIVDVEVEGLKAERKKLQQRIDQIASVHGGFQFFRDRVTTFQVQISYDDPPIVQDRHGQIGKRIESAIELLKHQIQRYDFDRGRYRDDQT